MITNFFKHRGYKYTLVAMFLVLIISLTGCQKGDIVAKIENESITKNELYDVLVEQNGNQVLDSLITEKIIDLETKKQNIKVSDEDVEKELDKMKEQYGGEEALSMAMMQYGLDMDALKENVKTNLKIKMLLEPEIEITEEDISDYFKENKEKFDKSEQVNARHILVETEEEANEISNKLESGEDFAELAKEYSKDPGSKTAGGDLGFFGKGEMAKEFEETAFSLKKNEVSKPIKSEHGYHIIEVLEKKEEEKAKLEDVKEDIQEMILQQKITTEFPGWYEKKVEEYKVENYLEDK